MKKERLDVLLIKKHMFDSREKAQAAIMAAEVLVDGVVQDKPGASVCDNAEIEVKHGVKYVSRGGLKLEKAFSSFPINVENKIVMDVGASTGGFTQCMLQHGAAKVIAVDVGYGQLAWQLRNDPRVVCIERTNIRYLTPKQIGYLVNFVVVDVSFISLKKVIPAILLLSDAHAEFVMLVKPQFEAGREYVGKKGVVRDAAVHRHVLMDVIIFCVHNSLKVLGVDFSPIKGPQGNIEYLLYMSKTGVATGENMESLVDAVVSRAHEELSK